MVLYFHVMNFGWPLQNMKITNLNKGEVVFPLYLIPGWGPNPYSFCDRLPNNQYNLTYPDLN